MNFCLSYCKNKTVQFFLPHVVYHYNLRQHYLIPLPFLQKTTV